MAYGTFAAVINCMDGRTQEPVVKFMKDKCGVDYVDMITEPGPIKFMDEGAEEAILGSIRNRVTISVEKHGAKTLAIVGHHDCAGNPVGKEIQLEQLKSSMRRAESWGLGVEIMGLWIDENWEVSQVY